MVVYRDMTRQYNALKEHGFIVRRGYSSYWSVSRGIAMYGSFATWEDAVAFAQEWHDATKVTVN